MKFSRRDLCITGLAATLGTLVFRPFDAFCADRSVRLYVPATGEHANITFWSDGKYLNDGIEAIQHVLRDFETDTVGRIDLGLLEGLHHLAHKLGGTPELEVVRGTMTNDPNQPFEVNSPNYFHTRGEAIDMRVQGVTLEHVAMEFVRWFDGGVGFYPQENFIHLDVGPSRRWQMIS